MKDLHTLLKRQLKRHLNVSAEDIDGPLLKFVQSVNDAYRESDMDRKMLERSLELSSAELMEANGRLSMLLEELEERVEKRTSELKESRLALRSSEERLRILYETAPIGIFQSLPSGSYLYANKQLARMYGYESPENLISSVTSIADTIYEDPGERAWVQAQLGEQGSLVGYETRRRRKDGSVFWVSLSMQACFDPDTRTITHYDGFVIDISIRKEAEKQLKQALEDAEDANRAKSIFLANMSHEIRTPLNGILGLAEVMLGTKLTASQERFMRQLKSSSHSLLNVLNDILDFSKIEANKLVIDMGPVHIRELVADSLRTLYIQARDKGLELMLQISDNVPETVEGDGDRLRQILLNIVSNAVKFTEFGEILVEVDFVKNDPEGGELTCSISDTGPGIPKEKLNSVFNAFEQIDCSLTRSRGGTGLGLTISSQLVSLMGGRMDCSSIPGRGSTFRFTLPLRVVKEMSRNLVITAGNELVGMHMLVVDCNSTNRSIVRRMLESWGAVVDEAESVSSAYDKVKQAVHRKEPYRIVVGDNKLDADGQGFLKELADNPATSSAIVIMLGGAEEGAAEICADSVLYKPVTASDLLSAIMKALRKESGLREDAGRQRVNVLATDVPLRILLVEDTPLNLQVAEHMIEGWGHTVIVATDGHEGFEKFISEDFDLVLMDVQMPVMDGLEATGHIRAYEQKNGLFPTPILAMTAHALKGDADVCVQAGMNDYIAKPIRWKELFAKIEEYGGKSRHKKQDRPTVRLAHAAQEENTAATDSLPGLDELVTRFNDDSEFLFQMIDILEDELSPRIERIRAAIEEMDFNKLEMEAHALKSMLGNFGKTGAYYSAHRLEHAGHDRSSSDTDQEFDKLGREIDVFMDHMRKLRG
ncbi:response regulator [Maridesulfovibrio sp.]|uniref:response regulator n=1 Tax=Maridesulfovibrio sp. TaxID=2795000 RepID=UPI002A18B1EF|nr:response regulator [Maridesulfovibrio sp.]